MSYSADNALQIAMQMERLGLTFYNSLAARCSDTQIVALAVKLADDEKKHLWKFERMYHSIPLERCGPKLTEDQLAADAGKFYKLILPTADEVSSVATSGDMVKVLAMAMQLEADAIAYYLSMTPASKEETAIIRGIAEEEKKHLALLREQRNHL
jgi:rubrerythrin